MSTELDVQLRRFAEVLDRDAPAISVDEIFGGGIIAVDVDRVEWPSRDRVEGVVVTSWGDATSSHDGNGERDASIEFESMPAEAPVRRRSWLKVAIAAAAVVLVVALASIVRTREEPGPADEPPATLPAPPPVDSVLAPPAVETTINELERKSEGWSFEAFEAVNEYIDAAAANAETTAVCNSNDIQWRARSSSPCSPDAVSERYGNLVVLARAIPGDDVAPYRDRLQTAYEQWTACLVTAPDRLDCADQKDEVAAAIDSLYNLLG